MKTNKNIAFLLMLFASIFSSFGMSNDSLKTMMKNANDLYHSGKYENARLIYEQIEKDNSSVALYYNLGNCYYRTNDLGHAILNYERAFVLDPSDEDVKHNLQIANSMTIDKIENADESVVYIWYSNLLNIMSSNGWAKVCICMFLLLLVGICVYLFVDNILAKRIGFFSGAICMVLFIFCFINASVQKNRFASKDKAIVCTEVSNAKSSPEDSSKNVFVLHEGTKVTVTDMMAGYYEIKLSNGNKGWIPVKDLELI